MVEVPDLNVNLAFTKKEKLTAKANPARLEIAWLAPVA